MPTFSDFVQTVTQDKYVPKVTDNILLGNVLTMRLLANPRPWIGGEQLRVPIKFQSSTALGSYAGWDTFSTTQANTRVRANYDPSQAYASVVINGIQQAVNKGDSAILDLLAVEMESVGRDFSDDLGTQFYADGTGNNSKDFVGLDALVDDGNGTATFAGLSRATYTTWVSDLDSSSNAITLAELRASFDQATIGTDQPTLGVTTPAIWTTIEGLLAATLTYYTQVQGYQKLTRFGIQKAGTGQTGDIGFDAINFRGIPIVKDQKCTSGLFLFLNENHLWFYKIPHAKHATNANGFAWTGLKEPTNQDADVGQMLLYGQLVTDSVRSHSYLTSKS